MRLAISTSSSMSGWSLARSGRLQIGCSQAASSRRRSIRTGSSVGRTSSICSALDHRGRTRRPDDYRATVDHVHSRRLVEVVVGGQDAFELQLPSPAGAIALKVTALSTRRADRDLDDLVRLPALVPAVELVREDLKSAERRALGSIGALHDRGRRDWRVAADPNDARAAFVQLPTSRRAIPSISCRNNQLLKSVVPTGLVPSSCREASSIRAAARRHHLYSLSSRHSSAVEQLFRKQQVLGSNPSVGSSDHESKPAKWPASRVPGAVVLRRGPRRDVVARPLFRLPVQAVGGSVASAARWARACQASRIDSILGGSRSSPGASPSARAPPNGAR